MHTSGQSKTMPRSPQTASGRKTTRRRATSNAHYSATAFDTDSETDMHDNDDLPRRTSIATPQSTLVRSPLQRSQSTRPSPVHRQHSDNQSTSHGSLSSESHLTLADEDLTTVITTTIMKTPPIGPPAQNTYQQKIRIDDETNNNNIHNNMAAGESDDEEEDDADVEEWNELTELLEEIDGDHQSGGRHEIEDSRIIQMWNWARRFTVNLLLISLVLVPGLICQFAYPGQCMIYGTGFLYYSIMFTVLIFGFFFADALVMILMRTCSLIFFSFIINP
jgi:hypothetical protein